MALVFTPTISFAAQRTWDGSTDATWNDATNWDGIPLDTADDIVLNGVGTNPTTNDFAAGFELTGITFAAATPALTITGANLDLSGASSVINSSTATQTIDLNLTLNGGQTLDADLGALAFGGTINNGGNALTVQGPFDTTISGVISGAGSLVKTEAGTLTLSGINTYTGVTTLTTGTIDLGANLGATATSIGDGTTLNLTSSVTNGGATTHTLTGTLDLNGYTYTSTGIYTLANTSILNLDVSSSTASGSVVATAAGSTLNAGATIGVTVTGAVADGSTYTIIQSDAAETGGQTVTDNSSVVSFTSAASGNNIVLTASRSGTAYNDLASGANASAAGAALEADLLAGPTGDMLDVLNTIDLLSAAEIETAMSTLDPDMSAGTIVGSLNALNQSLGTVTSHLDTVRNGISTGDSFDSSSIWAKGFGNFSDQGTRSGIEGFESYTYGTALGYDILAEEVLTLGISGGYAYTEVDPKQANLNDTEIGSYQGTLYASYNEGPWYVDGMFGFAWNNYDGSRRLVAGTKSRIANADYDGQQYTGYLGAGYTVDSDLIEELEGFNITPMASLQYTRLHIAEYTESGAGSINLQVNSQDYDVLESGLGLKIAYPMENSDLQFIPEIHGMWYYDYIADKAQATSKFTGGGASFTTNGASPEHSSFDVGSQITFITQNDISLILGYDLELKDDFHSHSGALTVKYDF